MSQTLLLVCFVCLIRDVPSTSGLARLLAEDPYGKPTKKAIPTAQISFLEKPFIRHFDRTTRSANDDDDDDDDDDISIQYKARL
jgi:hypothetical protein